MSSKIFGMEIAFYKANMTKPIYREFRPFTVTNRKESGKDFYLAVAEVKKELNRERGIGGSSEVVEVYSCTCPLRPSARYTQKRGAFPLEKGAVYVDTYLGRFLIGDKYITGYGKKYTLELFQKIMEAPYLDRDFHRRLVGHGEFILELAVRHMNRVPSSEKPVSQEYRVTWETQVEAASFEEAARLAYLHMIGERGQRWFNVSSNDGKRADIYLEN